MPRDQRALTNWLICCRLWQPRAMTRWTKRKERGERYVYVDAFRVTVGEHDGSGHSDYASTCSHAAFLAGQFHDELRQGHSKATLRKALAAVAGAVDNPDFRVERERVAALLSAWSAIPVDENLAALAALPDDQGMVHYGLRSTDIAIEHQGLRWLVVHQSIRLEWPDGQTVFELPAAANALSLGNFIRVHDVIRCGERVLFCYRNDVFRDLPDVVGTLGHSGWLEVTPIGVTKRARQKGSGA